MSVFFNVVFKPLCNQKTPPKNLQLQPTARGRPISSQRQTHNFHHNQNNICWKCVSFRRVVVNKFQNINSPSKTQHRQTEDDERLTNTHMDAAANKRGRGKGTRSTGRTVAAAVAVGGGGAANSGTNSPIVVSPSVVTLERRSTLPIPSITGNSSSTVLGKLIFFFYTKSSSRSKM